MSLFKFAKVCYFVFINFFSFFSPQQLFNVNDYGDSALSTSVFEFLCVSPYAFVEVLKTGKHCKCKFVLL